MVVRWDDAWDERTARARCEDLGVLVRALWQRGWEPADLHGWAVRQRPAGICEVLGDAMAADLARHADATIEPRWHDQLEEIGASVWWARETDHLTARAERDPGGLAGVQEALTTLLLTLRCLPTLEQIAALPGEAHARSGDVSGLDQRLLTKVRMMLAKAESTTFEEEADAFTAAAQKLMSRHSIDRAMLEQARRTSEQGREAGGPRAIRLAVDRPYDRPKFVLLAEIAEANRCRAIWNQHIGRGTVVGFEVDLRAVELLYASLLVQAAAAMRAEGPRRTVAGASRTRSFRGSFLTGFATRIGERLARAAEQETAAAAGELDGRACGTEGTAQPPATGAGARTEVALVLADRQEEVQEAVAQRFPRLGRVRSTRTWDSEGYRSGRAAAEQAQLGVRGRLA